MATDDARPNVHDMVLVHRVFRRELRLLPELITGVPDGDTARATQIGGHLDLMLSFLGVHHEGEDLLLWPLLAERAPGDVALLERMQKAHEQIHDQLDAVEELQPAWQAEPSAADGAELAAAITTLADLLEAHLDEEEREVLPLAQGHLSVAEWAKLGEHGFGHVAPPDRLSVLGSILEDTSPAERAEFLGNIDPMAAQMWSGGGEDAYVAYVAQIRGTG